MAYGYNNESGSGIAGKPSPQENAAGQQRNQADEWDPDRETWEEFSRRTE